ncbi:hypothetical protein PsorP6_004695 [Peronosclerospora sorghi]|uniref:Uncharacterized protein n=1 Tax=Peronosclerospora sorghi TaxID=230839 RepID=A0ACC0VKG0_9STRA|nr:hypothetical protein PsorP6_004695 [Peronosclerospora sorghi]
MTTARELRPLYKKLLHLAQSLPEPKRLTSIDKIRQEFRSHVDLTDSKEISALIQRAQSSLDFLRIVTPRTASGKCIYSSCCSICLTSRVATSDKGVQRFIYRNGKRVNASEFKEKIVENARYKTQDMEAGLRRHHQLLRRQHFMDRKSGPPRPIF